MQIFQEHPNKLQNIYFKMLTLFYCKNENKEKLNKLNNKTEQTVKNLNNLPNICMVFYNKN